MSDDVSSDVAVGAAMRGCVRDCVRARAALLGACDVYVGLLDASCMCA